MSSSDDDNPPDGWCAISHDDDKQATSSDDLSAALSVLNLEPPTFDPLPPAFFSPPAGARNRLPSGIHSAQNSESPATSPLLRSSTHCELLNIDQARITAQHDLDDHASDCPTGSLRTWGCEAVSPRKATSERPPKRRHSQLRRSLVVHYGEDLMQAITSRCTCQWKEPLHPHLSWVLQICENCTLAGQEPGSGHGSVEQTCIGGAFPKSNFALRLPMQRAQALNQQAINNCFENSLSNERQAETHAAEQHKDLIRLLESTSRGGLKAPEEAVNWTLEQVETYFANSGDFLPHSAGPFKSDDISFALVVGSFFSNFDEPPVTPTRQVRRSLVVRDGDKLVEMVTSACTCRWKELRHPHQSWALQACTPCLLGSLRKMQDPDFSLTGKLEDWEAQYDDPSQSKVMFLEDVSEFFEDAEFGFFGKMFEKDSSGPFFQ